MDSRAKILWARCESEGQGHLFAFYPELDLDGRERLCAQVEALDLARLRQLVALVKTPELKPAPPRFSPPTVFPLVRDRQHERHARSARECGEELLRAGKVAYLLVAGGQASRLGYDGPKGCFPIGPVSGCSLFELFAHKLRAAYERYRAPTWWYIMTSRANDRATRTFFAENDHFGVDPATIRFFSQAMLPALDREGRIVLCGKDELFLAPDGHGGVLAALAGSGGLEHARRNGVSLFSFFQVDNPLAPPADPMFLGLHALDQAQMSSKVVRKRDAAEKVGVLGKVDGNLCCIEYSDLPAHLREARGSDGELLFGAGNIAMHAIDLEFIDRLTQSGLLLPWHLAHKIVPAIDSEGRPARREVIKFETFVFDALQAAGRSVILEVDRAREFSPVKNASGEDSPATARADLCRMYASWLTRAGLPLPPAGPDGNVPVEVDPLFATDVETFLEHDDKTPRILPDGHMYA